MKFKVAICQIKVVDDKKKNIIKAIEEIEKASKNGALLAVLPEMFNCPYENGLFRVYAESVNEGETLKSISEACIRNNIFVLAGSIPEIDSESRIYNTAFLFDNEGRIIARHRKIHLFDIDIPDKITFRESDTLTPGNSITIADTPFAKVGIAICYDIRFPEIFRIMALKGVDIILVPAAFNHVTGPAHFELLVRTRALDNQIFMVAAAPAYNSEAYYHAYGNSMIVDPWGTILTRASDIEDTIYAEIDIEYLYNIRQELPVIKQRREDIYKDCLK